MNPATHGTEGSVSALVPMVPSAGRRRCRLRIWRSLPAQ